MPGSTDDTSTLGHWLTRLRTRSALASADLAALVGVTKRTLLAWERGRSHPNALRLRRLLAVLAAHGGFAPALASAEAAALWDQANREANAHAVNPGHDDALAPPEEERGQGKRGKAGETNGANDF